MVFSKVGPNQSIEWGQFRVSKSDVYFERKLCGYCAHLLDKDESSVVGSKPANGGQVKTGQRMWPGTWFFYPIFS